MRPSVCSNWSRSCTRSVISQDDAIKADLPKAIRRARAGLKDPEASDAGSFIFCRARRASERRWSPRRFAEFMFGDEEALDARSTCPSTWRSTTSPGSSARLPATSATRRAASSPSASAVAPTAVILLDEVEKAHPDVFNMLLQIMEEGRLTDSFGRNVDFRNTILIMTSNIGADLIKGGGGFGFAKRSADIDHDNVKTVLMKEIERFFRPEFINRLDDIIVFRPLTREDLSKIVLYEVSKVAKRLKDQALTMELDDVAREFLIEKGYNPEYGARPLRRSIGTYIEDPLSEMLLSKDIPVGGTVHVTRRKDSDGKFEDHLYFTTTAPTPPPETEKPVGANAGST